jgi:hypothetical protein
MRAFRRADNSDSGIPTAAADEHFVYTHGPAKGGVTAFKLESGEQVWRTLHRRSAAPGVQPAARRAGLGARGDSGAVLPGRTTATYAYSSSDGRIVWVSYAARPYDTVNLAVATGGTVRGASQIVANGILFMNSATHSPAAGNADCFLVDGK